MQLWYSLPLHIPTPTDLEWEYPAYYVHIFFLSSPPSALHKYLVPFFPAVWKTGAGVSSYGIGRPKERCVWMTVRAFCHKVFQDKKTPGPLTIWSPFQQSTIITCNRRQEHQEKSAKNHSNFSRRQNLPFHFPFFGFFPLRYILHTPPHTAPVYPECLFVFPLHSICLPLTLHTDSCTILLLLSFLYEREYKTQQWKRQPNNKRSWKKRSVKMGRLVVRVTVLVMVMWWWPTFLKNIAAATRKSMQSLVTPAPNPQILKCMCSFGSVFLFDISRACEEVSENQKHLSDESLWKL